MLLWFLSVHILPMTRPGEGREGRGVSGNGLAHTFAGEPCAWLDVLMAANGQAKDLGLVLDEGQARFDVVIRRHF